MPFTGMQYNPTAGYASIDTAAGKSQQMNTFYWLKKSLIEARKEQYFMPLASTIGMPKHFGKTIKLYEYVPLLDDRNVNDQGIDAAGATILSNDYYVRFPALVMKVANASKAAVAAAINDDKTDPTITATAGDDDSGGTGFATITVNKLIALYDTDTKANLAAASVGGTVTRGSGNLYGSSKDIGTITSKLPLLSETGGRVNRVGFTRLELEGTFQKFGFFYEFTKESLDFDSDEELNSHLSRELMNGAVQLTEAVLQKDLLSACGTVVYAGQATADNEVSGEANRDVVAYEDLMRLDQILTDNRTPKQTTVITGSRLVDTKTIPAGRVLFVGSELVPTLKAMKDLFNNPAFIAVQHYADAGNVLNGEIGMIDAFHIVQVPEMLHWAGAGGDVTTNPGYRTTNDRYDVFPMLCIGDDSFTTIGFQTDGKSAKFQVITKMPGTETADRDDPYGETGFSSIKWYYGILVKRPERLGLIKTVAAV
jgi:N4-gp56 family major capsid protein